MPNVPPAICIGALQGEALPPSLVWASLPFTPVPSADVQAARARFAATEKARFLVSLAEAHKAALAHMGLGPEAIESMADGALPQQPKGVRLDASVDHIRSLHAGGTNALDNMMLLPLRLNALKNRIERSQADCAAAEGRLWTIVPHPPTPVPYVPGGFSRSKALS